jgi:CRISPR/Cas system-associated endonuclease/helicase Cas3
MGYAEFYGVTGGPVLPTTSGSNDAGRLFRNSASKFSASKRQWIVLPVINVQHIQIFSDTSSEMRGKPGSPKQHSVAGKEQYSFLTMTYKGQT